MTLFTVFGCPVTADALVTALGGLLAAVLATVSCQRRGLGAAAGEWFSLLAIPLCLLGARLGYCLMRYYFVRDDMGWGFFFRFTTGGYVLYGALLGGLLAAWLASRIVRRPCWDVTDAVAPAAALCIAFCRFAEGLAQQGFGWEVESEALWRFPWAVYIERQDCWFWSLSQLEGLVALGLMLALLLCGRGKARRGGDRTLLLLLGYASLQLVLESMRCDAVLKWGMVRCSQLVSAIVVGFVLFVHTRRIKGHPWQVALCWAGTLACFGLVMAMEFAVENKIEFLYLLFYNAGLDGVQHIPYCYAAMALGAVGALLIGLKARSLSYRPASAPLPAEG